MSPDAISDRIPQLDRLIDEKLTAIASCIGRDKNMGDFTTLSEDKQDTLLNDAFDRVVDWEEHPKALKDIPPNDELQRLIFEHYELTQEMRALHREVERQELGSN